MATDIYVLNYYGLYFSYFKIIQSVFIFTGDKKMLLLITKGLNHHNSSLIYYLQFLPLESQLFWFLWSNLSFSPVNDGHVSGRHDQMDEADRWFGQSDRSGHVRH